MLSLSVLIASAFALAPVTVPAVVPTTAPAVVPVVGTTAPINVPTTIPNFSPGINPAATTAPAPAVIQVPGTAPVFVPGIINGVPSTQVPALAPTFVPGPGAVIAPQAAGPAPSIVPFVQNAVIPGVGPVAPFVTTGPGIAPATIPGTVPGTTPGVPGFAPALVPGVVPAVVVPGTPQPPVTVFGAAAAGVACSPCTADTGSVVSNGKTVTWTRTCTPCIGSVLFNTFFTTNNGCTGLTGFDLNECCRDGLRPAICGVPVEGRPAICTCNGNVIACPGCDESKKGLLGLLGLLGLIPLLLCSSLLLCLFWLCCLRGSKKGPDTHFATYAPNAVAMPTVVEHCAPTLVEHCEPVAHCDYPMQTCA